MSVVERLNSLEKNIQGEHITHECPQMDKVHRLLALSQSTQQPIVLNHSFLAQPQ